MRVYYRFALAMISIVSVSLFQACDDDEVQIFEAPTISVVADNNTPFADENITFTIQVAALGGLKEVTLDGAVIKQYNANDNLKEDEFTHVVTLPQGTPFGNKTFVFDVADLQNVDGGPKTAESSVTVEVKNPAERGSPLMITRFDFAVVPAGPIANVSTAKQDQGWGEFPAGEFTFGANNPLASNTSKVVQYKKVNTWGWEQYVSMDIDFASATSISEDEWEAVANGDRVLQVNAYFQHVESINQETGQNDSQVFPAGGYIPIEVYVGDKEKWGFVNGVNTGRRIWLRGRITQNTTWQTITFEAFDPDEGADPTAPKNVDASVGFNQIDRISIAANPGGFMRNANDENVYPGGFSGPFDHNNYFFYNLRTIDAAEADNNPNM